MKKVPDNQIQKPTDGDLQDYMFATLSVLSQKNSEPCECPDPEVLAAFSEGRLAGKKRKAIVAHLAVCASCRHHWKMIASASDDMGLGEGAWKEKIIQRLKNLKPHRAFAAGGVGIALVTCLLLVVLLPQKDELSNMISKSYLHLPPKGIAHYNSFVSRGEDENPEKSAALSAYLAGVADGRARLLSQTESTNKALDQEKLLSLLYSLGRWAVVLRCACISPNPASDAFWAEQEAIALKIHKEIQNAVKAASWLRAILQPVTTITRAIEQIRKSDGTAIGCEDITSALKTIENQLQAVGNYGAAMTGPNGVTWLADNRSQQTDHIWCEVTLRADLFETAEATFLYGIS